LFFSVLAIIFKGCDFFLIKGLVEWEKSLNFALPNDGKAAGKKEKGIENRD
jgi:hypothetical protein